MEERKKYVCIREDFFEDEKIKKLEEYGSEYVLAYLELYSRVIETRGITLKTMANKIGVNDEMLKIFKKIGLIIYEDRQIAVKQNKKIMVK